VVRYLAYVASAPIIMTGMHRSGTSLVASVFARAGVHLGDRMLGPGPGNPRGYFEDLEIVDLHERALASCGTTMYVERAGRLALPPEVREHARAIVAARGAHASWGFKDPRTTLFLDDWDALAPGARYVFVYRDAAGVLTSLARRRDPALHRQYPGAVALERLGAPRFRFATAIETWRRYNRALIAFAERAASQCCVVRFEDVAVALPRVLARLRTDGFDLDDVCVADVIDGDPAARRPDGRIARRCRRHGDAATLLARLDTIAARVSVPPTHRRRPEPGRRAPPDAG